MFIFFSPQHPLPKICSFLVSHFYPSGSSAWPPPQPHNVHAQPMAMCKASLPRLLRRCQRPQASEVRSRVPLSLYHRLSVLAASHQAAPTGLI